ncbi:MAG TPA: branched-chain amino acid ABC transporter permease [Synergistaceae bacterium]|jgi:branched-chain amino acid transport system permease protein|nr:branched-chain amino acid ABC transporter permease [Synergistaceae bacterium]NLL41247.1 branched-chain amino acid ABC transporter permease [Synergistaceae bacterium]HPX03137.1 branched-chain amino acid ABC transporter permease [Synergistaceae bacterium]HQA54003.1 branched-chain amino acid ABC transporter permease [Synergistaceae bacterium]
MLIKDKSDKLWYGFLAVAVVLPFIPGVIGGSFFGHVATMILLYAAMAQSWNIISGYCGQTSFGHSVFFGIGAYAASLAVVTFESLPWYGVPLGMLVAAVVSIVISYPCFKLKGHYFAIATFAIVEIFNRLFMIWDAVGGALGLDYPILPDGWKNFSWSDTKNGYYLGALVIFALVFSVVRWIERHRMGYYLRAVREGQETAESLGVNSTIVKLSAMALSASLAALCGSFFAQYNYRVDPPMVMSLDMSMKFVLITILGGIGTFWGPFLGALVLIPLQEYTRAYLSNLGAGVDLMIFGLIIIVVMIKQPQGIMGLIRYFTRKKIVREEGDA